MYIIYLYINWYTGSINNSSWELLTVLDFRVVLFFKSKYFQFVKQFARNVYSNISVASSWMFIVYFLPLINWYAWARVCVKREEGKTLLLFICKSCVSFFLLLLLFLFFVVGHAFCCLVRFFLNWVTHVAIKAAIVCVYNIHSKLNTHNKHQELCSLCMNFDK